MFNNTLFVIFSSFSDLEVKNNCIPKVFVDFCLEATEVTLTQTEQILSQVAFSPSVVVNVNVNNYNCTDCPVVKSIIDKHIKKIELALIKNRKTVLKHIDEQGKGSLSSIVGSNMPQSVVNQVNNPSDASGICNTSESSEICNDSVSVEICNTSESSEICNDSVSVEICNTSEFSEICNDSVSVEICNNSESIEICNDSISSGIYNDSICNDSISSEICNDSISVENFISSEMCNNSDSAEICNQQAVIMSTNKENVTMSLSLNDSDASEIGNLDSTTQYTCTLDDAFTQSPDIF